MIDGGYEFVEIKVHLNQEWPESVIVLKYSRCNANDFALFERFDCHKAFWTLNQVCEGTSEKLIESNGVAREPPGSILLESRAEFAGRCHAETSRLRIASSVY